MKTKLIWLGVIGAVVAVFALGILDFQQAYRWVRYGFFRAKGTVGQVTNVNVPKGDPNIARVCRENLHRIQAAKRSAAQQRGNPIGAITWEEVLRALPEVPKRALSPAEKNQYTPKCPGGGTYSVGTLEEVPRCSISGNDSLALQDDHIIRD